MTDKTPEQLKDEWDAARDAYIGAYLAFHAAYHKVLKSQEKSND